MSRRTIALDPPVPAALADELAKRVYFVSDTIVDFALVRSGQDVVAVDVELSAGADGTELDRKLRWVVANDVLPQQATPARELWRAPRTAAFHDTAFDQLVASGAVFEAGEGQLAVGEPVLGLMDALDALVLDIAATEFGAVQYRYPTLLPLSVLERSGYLKSFPQQLMFMARLHSDVDGYRSFMDQAAGGDRLDILAHCAGSEYFLPPTMCLHTYHQLRDAPLASPSLVVTSRGKSFRFETRYRRTLERLWDFTIREIVFVGDREFVLDCRQRFLSAAIALVERLGLQGFCEVANDPFFLGRSADHIWSQRLLELKYELRLNVTEDDTIAVGSFNFHERFFADAFGIAAPGPGRVHTGCVGFGLERLAYAFLCQHGIDPAHWPDLAPRRTQPAQPRG
ncbi:class-II aminoacyl-tRNA synthetase family protein [Hamadaea tsunoensis]|uniref:hypothetical protein n=1 Tax=Hamadaea tsunoensis TaxID=53368 RepID=UPI000418B1CD|nr:hypothetical protein [Hamadaea tsunoensis]